MQFYPLHFLEAALARSARASRRLNLASSTTPMHNMSVPILRLLHEKINDKLTGIGIAGKVAAPGDVGPTLVRTRRNGVDSDRAHN